MWHHVLAMVLVAADQNTAGGGSDPITPWLNPLISLGGFGLLLVLLLTGKLRPDSSYQELKSDRDEWKRAFEILRDDRQSQIERDRVIQHLLEEIKEVSKKAGQ